MTGFFGAGRAFSGGRRWDSIVHTITHAAPTAQAAATTHFTTRSRTLGSSKRLPTTSSSFLPICAKGSSTRSSVPSQPKRTFIARIAPASTRVTAFQRMIGGSCLRMP